MSDSSSPDLLTASEVVEAMAQLRNERHWLDRIGPAQRIEAHLAILEHNNRVLSKRLLAVRSVPRISTFIDQDKAGPWVNAKHYSAGEFVSWLDVSTAAGAEL